MTPKLLEKQDSFYLKKQARLLRWAARFPGALSAHFLNQVRMKTGLPYATSTDDLRATDVSRWAALHSELKDVRDVREAALLGFLLSELGRGGFASCGWPRRTEALGRRPRW